MGIVLESNRKHLLFHYTANTGITYLLLLVLKCRGSVYCYTVVNLISIYTLINAQGVLYVLFTLNVFLICAVDLFPLQICIHHVDGTQCGATSAGFTEAI